VTEPAIDGVAVVSEVRDNAPNLGMTWTLRPATVGTFDGTTRVAQITLDGDAESVPAISLVDGLMAGTRVMVMSVPPSGNYIVGITGYANDTAWTDFAMVTTSSGTPPSVGSGSQGARWIQIAHKTILLEGFVLFGAGMSQGTGRYFFPVPFNCSVDGFAATGTGYILDTGTANRGAFAVNFTSSRNQLFITNTPSSDVGAGIPQVFAAGDQILFSIMYEVDSF
jgi:hypothetical protein